MKKILSLIVLMAGVTMFTACGDDDATYTAIPKLDVQSAALEFEAVGGTNTVSLNTSSAVTAVVENGSAWLTAIVNGNTVSLTAAANSELTGRSATILLKTGDAETRITATQKGAVYGLPEGLEYTMEEGADTLAIPIAHSVDVQVQSLADWIQASFNAEAHAIEVIASANDSGDDRYGLVAIATGVVRDTLTIVQKAQFVPYDGYGSYTFVYYDLTEEDESAMVKYQSAELTENALQFNFKFQGQDLPLAIPAKANGVTGVVSFGPHGSVIGTFPYQGTNLDLRLMWLNMDGDGTYSDYTDTQSVATGKLTVEEGVDPDDGEPYSYTVMEFGGTFDDKSIDAWVVKAFYGGFTEDGDVGSIGYLGFPYMIKTATNPEAAAKRFAAKNGAAMMNAARKASFQKRYGRQQTTLRTPWKK